MHTEHISNLHPGWVIGGWLVAVAVASAVFLVLVGAGLLPTGAGEMIGSGAALAVCFFAGGLFVGMRWSDASVLHGVAITLLSVLVWFASALLVPGALAGSWREEDAAFVLGAILLQLVATVAGGLADRALVLRGQTPDPVAMLPEA